MIIEVLKCIGRFLKKPRNIIFIILGVALIALVIFYSKQNRFDFNTVFCGKQDTIKAIDGVVRINGKDATGSGFWVGPDIVLTNNHVISFNRDFGVIDSRGFAYGSKLLATDSVRDLALIRVTGSPGKALKWREKPIELLGEVYALGYPFDGKQISVTKGIVSGITKDKYDDREYIQTDAALNDGNSGGPLVDKCGRVVGLNTSAIWNAENMGFATKAAQVEEWIKEMLEKSKSASPEERAIGYPSDQAEVLAKYYDTLGQGKLKEAYEFYSVKIKEKVPFESWQEGFLDTAFIRIKSVESIGEPSDEFSRVRVEFITTDFGESLWEYITKEFEGDWILVRENGLWKLDEPNISEVEEPTDN